MLSGCTGSVIPRSFLTNGTADFDFRHPPPCPVTKPSVAAAQAEVRYLGSGGVAIRWRDDVLLIGPYFSHAGGILAAQFGNVRPDQGRIAEGLHDVDVSHVRAIVTGHSHFDHLGDVPVVAGRCVTSGPVYTNDSGRKLLAAYPDIAARVVTAESITGWVDVGSSMRIRPFVSDHAPQLCRLNRWPCTYAKCPVAAPETREWDKVRMRDLCGGQTFAWVIDLLDAKQNVRFRVYYNDAAAPEHVGAPPQDLQPMHRFDLAIICMASYDLVRGYPDWLLKRLQPRHVMISHYDDFFTRQPTPSLTFVPLLSNAKAKRFMERLRDATAEVKDPVGPSNSVCGPSTNQWSMPVPNGTLIFPVRETGS